MPARKANSVRNRVTLRDVARRAGVHPSTVSRVLNPETREMVSTEVTARVRKIAGDMGYHANPFAYSLKTRRSFTVGVLIPDLTNPVFPPIIRAVERTLGAAGYTAILADSDNCPERERVILQKLKARQVDGLILATAQRADELVDECLAEGLSVVLVNRSVEDEGVLSVTGDDAQGVRLAVDHIAELGHRHIAHVAGPQHLSTGFSRYHGFLEAMRARGLTPDEPLITFCDAYSEPAGRAALHALLARGRAFTAVVAANDLLALGCYDALAERGLVCPDDLSVTGFNDMPFVDKFTPPLTTVHIALDEMGERAAQMLLQAMRDSHAGARPVQLSPRLVVRGSTARPSARTR